MRQTFDTANHWIGGHEDGYSNHPDDPGGPTNHGVTQAVYDAYRRRRKLPTRDVREISSAEVNDIRLRQYWIPAGGDVLPVGLDYAVFDFCYHSGANRAVKELQRQLATKVSGIKADGIVGEMTLDAVERYGSVESLIAAYCARRMAFLQRLKNWSSFKTGWTRRVVGHKKGVQADDIGVLDRATMLARGDDPTRISRPKTLPDYANRKATDGQFGLFALIAAAFAAFFAVLRRRND